MDWPQFNEGNQQNLLKKPWKRNETFVQTLKTATTHLLYKSATNSASATHKQKQSTQCDTITLNSQRGEGS